MSQPEQPTTDLLQREQAFHDQWASTINLDEVPVEAYFEACTAPENRFILRQLGNVSGKSLLDLGCGAGENSVYFAQQGANCVASDYSPGMVDVALKLADQHGVAIAGRVINAMEIDYPDNSFDIVYAANLLHHIPDPLVTIQEIHRVLKPGGKMCFWDPLQHNPVINVYRRIATEVRTEDETPLHINLIKQVESRFSTTHADTFWIATLWIFLQFYLIERVNPNEERYWKKIILEANRLRPTYRRLEKVDRFLKKLPGMQRMAWNVAVVATK
ncbi:class I SAM-dependent methyltransferase [filamentous cyanobacterium LEGE 11480]|uniref:Class I SAM-dependent methyltransferase n=1 Tax=Romeriopsis navalis LEGE 11480 TaxID=2777977 RepID=A0A928VN91_9CYAN|nr:class I SAM-dependent methyltransferase [Romeriopsis navalis]MBE9030803.1 class I SAM-dependent methyltransferase [Romeriopsis navalis LEGE 11480]